MYFNLNIVYLYTNLIFTEEERKDEEKLYDELKRHLSYEALAAGNLLKKGAKRANTFVVIDMNPNSEKSVYAYSIKELL